MYEAQQWRGRRLFDSTEKQQLHLHHRVADQLTSITLPPTPAAVTSNSPNKFENWKMNVLYSTPYKSASKDVWSPLKVHGVSPFKRFDASSPPHSISPNKLAFGGVNQQLLVTPTAPLSAFRPTVAARFPVQFYTSPMHDGFTTPMTMSSFVRPPPTTSKSDGATTAKEAFCAFCRRNGETREFFTSHALKDVKGRVTCPILRRHVCRYCGASGDGAHTDSYCSNQPTNKRLVVAARSRPLRDSLGRLIPNKRF